MYLANLCTCRYKVVDFISSGERSSDLEGRGGGVVKLL